MVITMPTCEKKHRPKITELPQLFKQFGGNLTALGASILYTPKQIRRWMKEAGPAKEAELEAELKKAREEADKADLEAEIRNSKAKQVQSALSCNLPLSEVKHLFHTFYHTPWPVLDALDKSDFDGMGYEKSTSVRTKPNPNTNETLHQQLSWQDVKDIASAMNEAEEHILMCWVGVGSRSTLSLRLKALEPPEYPGLVTVDQKEAVLSRVYDLIAPKLIKRPEKLKR